MSSRYDNLLANVPTDLWIGGKWRKASDGGRFDVLDPATDNKIATVASATVEDARAAVDAASDAFPAWAAKKPRERAEIVSIVADEAFYDLDGPPVRITTPHIPLPAADILEDIALPTVDRIVERVHRSMQG